MATTHRLPKNLQDSGLGALMAGVPGGGGSKSSLWRRQEQISRWEQSDTNKDSGNRLDPEERFKNDTVDGPDRKVVRFQAGCRFLAACSARDTAEVAKLLATGADINTANVDGLTALHQACIDDNIEMMKFLVDHGADVNARDSEGWTALHATASCGFIDMARYLIKHGARLDVVNSDGDLPVDIAEGSDIRNLLNSEMLAQGIDADVAKGEEEQLMIRDASLWLNSRYDEKPDPKTGAMALHVAAAKGYVKVITLLLDAGADINAQDHDGWAPLHAAAHWCQKEAIILLSRHYANFDIATKAGQTPLEVADEEVVELMEELKKKQTSIIREKKKEDINGYEVGRRTSMFKDQRRSSITRLNTDQRKTIQAKNSEEERAQLEAAMRQSVVEENEDDVKSGDEVEDVGGDAPQLPTHPIPGDGRTINGMKIEPIVSVGGRHGVSSSLNLGSVSTSTGLPSSLLPATARSSSSIEQHKSELETTRDTLTSTVNSPSTAESAQDVRGSVVLRQRTSQLVSTGDSTKTGIPSLTPTKRASVPVTSSFTSTTVPPTAALSARLNALSCNVTGLQSSSKSSYKIAEETPLASWRASLRRAGSSSGSANPSSIATLADDLESVYSSQSGSDTQEPAAGTGMIDLTTPSVAAAVNFDSDCISATARALAKTDDISTDDAGSDTSSAMKPKGPLLSSATSAALAAIANQRRSIEVPKRDETKEIERRLRARKARESRRSTQGVTKEDLESAEQSLQSAADESTTETSAPATATRATTTMGDESSTENKISGTEPSGSNLPLQYPWNEKKDSDSLTIYRKVQDPGVVISSPVLAARHTLRNSSIGSLNNIAATTAALTTANTSLSSSTRSLTATLMSSTVTSSPAPRMSSYREKYLQEKEAKEREAREKEAKEREGEKKEGPEEAKRLQDVTAVAPPSGAPNRALHLAGKVDGCTCTECEAANQASAIAAANRAKRKRESRRSGNRDTDDDYESDSSTSHVKPNTTQTTASAAEAARVDVLLSKPAVVPVVTSQSAASTQSSVVVTQSTRHPSITTPSITTPTVRGISSSTIIRSAEDSIVDYKKLYELQHNSNERLRADVQELKQELASCRSELAAARSAPGSSSIVSFDTSLDRREKRSLERKISELEEELKATETLKADNQRLKDENAALIRVISKLSK